MQPWRARVFVFLIPFLLQLLLQLQRLLLLLFVLLPQLRDGAPAMRTTSGCAA
ncbi:hypothetical protein EDF60_1602 [Leucobacter luti]|nr:hypothetical protein [Leucobacter luti]TCK41183.1 hypothetical protein EDF60_1602 [Leucobacter luti]